MSTVSTDDERLLEVIGATVPRYTSYPTAPHFNGEVDEARHADWLAEIGRRRRPISLYLHVPFCRELCHYCGCATRATRKDEPIAAYVALMRRELAMVAAHTGRVPVTHIHWGGGTPNLVPAGLMGAVIEDIARHFDLGAGAEHAMEVDPRRLTADYAAAMAAAGINRASLGVQDLEPSVQAAIGRLQPLATVEAAIAALRAAGIAAINFDLIYGLPLQTPDGIRQTAMTAAGLAPKRISLFGYAHVPWFRPHQKLIDEALLPKSAERLALARAARSALEELGYRAIGIDHFARSEDELVRVRDAGTLRRNFQGYTDDDAETLIGVGASAIGHTPWGYVQNQADTGAWQKAIAEGHLAVARGHVFSGDDLMRAEVIERLLCFFEVDLAAVAARHGADAAAFTADLDRLAPLVEAGWVGIEGARVTILEHGSELARLTAAAFDGYLARGGRHSAAV